MTKIFNCNCNVSFNERSQEVQPELKAMILSLILPLKYVHQNVCLRNVRIFSHLFEKYPIVLKCRCILTVFY